MTDKIKPKHVIRNSESFQKNREALGGTTSNIEK